MNAHGQTTLSPAAVAIGVEAVALAAVASVDGQEAGRRGDEQHADGDVDEEDPVPAWPVGEQPAGDHPDRRRDPGDGAVDAQHAVALGAFGEGHGEEREGGRRQQRRPQTLQGAGADQQPG
jgi:hypothetical protein